MEKINKKHKERFADYEEAVGKAVDECIKCGILRKVLLKNKSEVVNMILTEYNEEEVREFLRQEAWEEGMEAGRKKGIEEGVKIMVKFCMEIQFSKEDTMNKIKTDFSLSQEEAEFYIKEFWSKD